MPYSTNHYTSTTMPNTETNILTDTMPNDVKTHNMPNPSKCYMPNTKTYLYSNFSNTKTDIMSNPTTRYTMPQSEASNHLPNKQTGNLSTADNTVPNIQSHI